MPQDPAAAPQAAQGDRTGPERGTEAVGRGDVAERLFEQLHGPGLHRPARSSTRPTMQRSGTSSLDDNQCALANGSGALLAPQATADVERDMLVGQDLLGGDIVSFQLITPDPAVCRRACEGRADCRAWTWVKPGVQAPGAMCWLKSQVGAPS